MRKVELTLGEMALLAGTRALLGAGIGLLLSERLADEPRKAAGWTLVVVGLLTTLPLGIDVLASARRRFNDDGSENLPTDSARNEEWEIAYV